MNAQTDDCSQEQQKSVFTINRELAKLQFYGAGPKTAVIDPDGECGALRREHGTGRGVACL